MSQADERDLRRHLRVQALVLRLLEEIPYAKVRDLVQLSHQVSESEYIARHPKEIQAFAIELVNDVWDRNIDSRRK